MTIPSDNFNKDGKTVCVRSSKTDLICVVDPELKANLETPENGTVYIQLENHFLKVVDMVMPDDIKVLLVDAKAVGSPLSINKLYTDFVKGNMCTYLYNHIWFDADLLTYLSAAAIIEGTKPVTTTTPPKDLLTDFKDIHGSMTATQAKDWKDRGFDYAETKEWIDIGFEVGWAGFAEWLRDTKGGNYTSPSWIRDNVSDLDPLKTESKLSF
jgi:hypothetical protein